MVVDAAVCSVATAKRIHWWRRRSIYIRRAAAFFACRIHRQILSL